MYDRTTEADGLRVKLHLAPDGSWVATLALSDRVYRICGTPPFLRRGMSKQEAAGANLLARGRTSRRVDELLVWLRKVKQR